MLLSRIDQDTFRVMGLIYSAIDTDPGVMGTIVILEILVLNVVNLRLLTVELESIVGCKRIFDK